MGLVESFAWGVLAGSLVTLAVMLVLLFIGVIWAQKAITRALW